MGGKLMTLGSIHPEKAAVYPHQDKQLFQVCVCLCSSQSYSQHHYPRASGYPIHKQGSHAVIYASKEPSIHPSQCGAKLGPKPSWHSKAIVGEPQAPGAILNQPNMKGCLLWDSWEEFPQVIFSFIFLRRRKKERDAREKYYLCSFGGWLSVHHLRACLSHLGAEWRGKNN